MAQRLVRLALFAVVFVFASSPLRAAPIVIDFESLSDLEMVDSQFGSLVTFSNALALTAGSVGGSLNELDFPPASGVTLVIDAGGPMRLDFTAPISTFSGLFTYNSPLTIDFFGGAGLLGSTSSVSAANTVQDGGAGNELLSGAFAASITSLIISGSPFGGSFAFDDLTFEIATGTPPPVPEPSTLVLLGSGVVAVVRARYRADRRRHVSTT